MVIEFTKMHGLGNDFVVINAISQSINLSAEQIIKLCDRHFGIGCDQLLLVEKPINPQAEFHYRIFNADGGEVEQCGNGARCFALFVRQQGLTKNSIISVETACGLIELKIEAEQVTVNMGVPDFQPKSLPFLVEHQAETYNLQVNDAEYVIAAVSMGNPHAVMQVENLASMDINDLGSAIESHELFPNRVNVGFMQIINRDEIRLRVFERGVGETQACGTGACAAVAVGRMLGLLNETVIAHLNGGDLSIHWREQGQSLLMTGPASTVFDGKINVDN
ncbi:Diaminopimelate epimerase [hydrothermal vent metagenome]|uniref:diaminopimelate epimerase n=1 Tax=hydrothermal vent metagenome TaxID=652676 RepID=A0A3B0XF98_9ZZZZ